MFFNKTLIGFFLFLELPGVSEVFNFPRSKTRACTISSIVNVTRFCDLNFTLNTFLVELKTLGLINSF